MKMICNTFSGVTGCIVSVTISCILPSTDILDGINSTGTPALDTKFVLESSKMVVAVETVMQSGDVPNRPPSCPSTIPTDWI